MKISDIINGQTISVSIWNNFIHEEAIHNGYVINISDFESCKEELCVTLTRLLSDRVIKFYVTDVWSNITNINKLLLIRRGRS